MTNNQTKPLNILYLTDKSDRGESAMIMGVHQQGHQVRVFGKLDSPHVQRIRDTGIPVTDVRWKKKLDRKVLHAIQETVLQHGIDIIHTGNSRTTLHMVMATKKLQRMGKSPKLIAYLGVTGNVAWWSPLSWVRFLNPRIDRIICVAEGVRQYLLQDVRLWGLKLDPAKVVTIYKGHKLEWYQAEPADLRQFDIPAEAMVVTVASRLRPRKGIPELVRALGLCSPERNIHVLFLGHEGNAEILAEVAKLPHPERVHFGGYRQDAPAIMAASDVCCLPVLSGEGLSRAVIEGMAYGVCPLVTPVGGNTELVIDRHCGLVVPAGDEPALATAMEWLYDNPEQRKRMGTAARERIDKHFHSDETVKQTLALYREIMAE
ncbi:MAG TPA: glycosyltransferase family 4 protein [Xanthomonadales bacterium]|nr:glycosyltransferase family 4 protein [Xanthomonadales bacterium]